MLLKRLLKYFAQHIKMSWITQYIYCVTVADLGGAGGDRPIQKKIFQFLPAEKIQKCADTTSKHVF
jgi:hypothetical protein